MSDQRDQEGDHNPSDTGHLHQQAEEDEHWDR